MTSTRLSVSFADLMHLGHSYTNMVPLGVSLVASYAIDKLGDLLDVELFKDPREFSEHLDRKIPDVACFSSYIWNINISCEFARQIKRRRPETVVVFGGPNYPLDADAQQTFLRSQPAIDFFVFRDGEQPFVHLLTTLMANDFDVSRVKQARLRIPSCHYVVDGEMVQGILLPPVMEPDQIPSPYLSGLCDKFLASDLTPLTLTARGCPFTCTFCQEGDAYCSRVRRFSFERVRDELHYIAQRTSNPNLFLADSNFGMYPDDIRICQEIALVQKEYGWPKYFMGLSGKNEKARILEAALIIQNSVFGGDSIYLGAAVQSTDERVLRNIRRHNVSLQSYLDVAKTGKAYGMNTFSEVILCLPGDTKQAHFQSMFELIDARMNMVRSHQLMILPGAEISTKETLEQYGMKTRFRVMPKTCEPYELFGMRFVTPEIDEICVENNTLSFQDYLECRTFDLTVEVFYNNGIFRELLDFLEFNGIRISQFIMSIHGRVKSDRTALSALYDDFLRETQELYEGRDVLDAFLRQPGVMDGYVSGELGNNEQLLYRTLIILNCMEELHLIAFATARETLRAEDRLCDRLSEYLAELAEYSLLRKKDMLSVEKTARRRFHYDFVQLEADHFGGDPALYFKAEGIDISFSHTDGQRDLIRKYTRIHGLSNYGIANVLNNVTNVIGLYRKTTVA